MVAKGDAPGWMGLHKTWSGALSTIVEGADGLGRSHLKIEFDLSFEDYLDARGEKDVVSNNPKSLDLARMFILLLGGVVLITWNPISAAIGSGLLLILAAIVADHFLKRRAIKTRNNELHNDFERFSSGNYTFEADRNGWRLYSEREEQAHAWEELFMIKESSRILYLVTYSGACTLPKAAFTPEQQSQLKTWCECPALNDVNGEE